MGEDTRSRTRRRAHEPLLDRADLVVEAVLVALVVVCLLLSWTWWDELVVAAISYLVLATATRLRARWYVRREDSGRR